MNSFRIQNGFFGSEKFGNKIYVQNFGFWPIPKQREKRKDGENTKVERERGWNIKDRKWRKGASV